MSPETSGRKLPPIPTGWLRKIGSNTGRALRRPLLRDDEVVPFEEEELRPVPPVSGDEKRWPRLATMNPFTIGFFGMLGAMLAYLLVQATSSLSSILILVASAIFLALGLNPMVQRLERMGLRRGAAVALVALLLVAVVGLFVWALAPVVVEQVARFSVNMPRYLESWRSNERFRSLDERYDIIGRVTQYLSDTATQQKLSGGILGISVQVVNTLTSTFLCLILTLYFLSALPQFKEVIYELAPRSRRPRVRYLANQMFRQIGGYLTGLFLVALCASTCATLFLTILHFAAPEAAAPLWGYTLAIASLVALLAFIPLVGAFSYALVCTLLALAVAPRVLLAVAIYFLVYLILDAYVIQPRVFSKSVNVPGSIIIVAVLAGGSLLGIVGALLAIPMAAAIILLYREVLVPHLDRQ